MKKLEIGCGDRLHEGYDGLDMRDIPGIKYPNTDARKLPIEDNTHDEIFAHWLLEHFAWRELVDVLREWKRVLKSSGVLRIVTNNQAAHNMCLARGEITWREWVRLTYGVRFEEEGESGKPKIADCHKIGFTEDLLREFLEQAGFRDIKIDVQWQCRESDGGIKCPALLVEAVK